jgi:tetratricopeptide (TPR) repeat protein
VRVCRAGLVQHPSYLSAHVTLGRALMEIGEYDEAHTEFETVLAFAPDNLIALRSIAELNQRRGDPSPKVETPGEAESSLGAQATEAPVLAELEGWLAAILADRGRSASRNPPN